ncbi:MAG: PAS domain S-box protein [Thermoplasmata archaeon]|nr:PAS domain S-box protein [Thermoplasmata archaeon]
MGAPPRDPGTSPNGRVDASEEEGANSDKSGRNVGWVGNRPVETTMLGPDLSEAVLRVTPVGLLVIDPGGTIVWANPAYFETTGRDAGIVGRNFHEILEDDGSWSTTIGESVDGAVRSGASATFRSVRARYRHQAGGVYLDVDVRPLPGSSGGPGPAVLMIRDVTERVEEQRRARLFYESFQTSTNAMQLTDAEGVMVDVNPAYERIYGYTRAECIGRKPNLIRSKHTSPEVYERMWADLSAPDRGYWSGEITNRDRHGRERPVFLSITAIRTVGGDVTHYLGVAVDLSEQRGWELRAAHADKLASVGQLAAGVAHEINTPLANVMLVAESLRRRSTDPWALARLDTMTDQIEVAARNVRSLLDFARRAEPHVAELDLVDVARDSVAFLKGKQSADVEITEVYPRDPVPIHGDRGQLMQLFTNILNNAYDAMEGKGSIRISVRRQGARSELEIVDTGPGIPSEDLPHIFEPFFTTKPEGQGTGLGLAICHGIVQAHHGSIVARNVPGAGAGFLVSLPNSEGALPRSAHRSLPHRVNPN